MIDQIIEVLHTTLAALRAEWEGLAERRRQALLSGDKDALLAVMVRQAQIPYEAVEACHLAADSIRAELEAEARELEAERDALAAQLAEFQAEVNALWERIRPVQERYLRIRNNAHTATVYTIRAARLHEGVRTTDGDSPLERLLKFDIPRVRLAIDMLERWIAAVASEAERAVADAVQLLYGVAPTPIDRVLRFRDYAFTAPAACESPSPSPAHDRAASVAAADTPQATSPRVRKRDTLEVAHDTAHTARAQA